MDELENLPLSINGQDQYSLFPASPTIQVERNFMLLPIFNFDKRNATKSIMTIRKVPDASSGCLVSGKLVVATAGKSKDDGTEVQDSVPGPFDMSVLFGLMDLWQEQGRNQEGLVFFTFYQLCKRMGISDGGANLKAIAESISRMARTTIESVSAYYSAEKAARVNTTINILRDPTYVTGAGQRGRGQVCLSKHLLSNLQQNYSGVIDRAIYLKLRHDYAKRLYLILSYKSQFTRDASVGFFDFNLYDLVDLLPMCGKRKLFVSTIKQRLKGPLDELADEKIAKFEFIQAPAGWVLRLTPYSHAAPKLVGAAALPYFKSLIETVYGRHYLEATGITIDSTRDLLMDHDEIIMREGQEYSVVFAIIDAVAHNAERKRIEEKSRAAIISSYFKRPWELPLDFVPVDVKFKIESAKRAASRRTDSIASAEDDAKVKAGNYYELMSDSEFAHYKKKIISADSGASFYSGFNRTSPVLRSKITDLIFEEIKNGVIPDISAINVRAVSENLLFSPSDTTRLLAGEAQGPMGNA